MIVVSMSGACPVESCAHIDEAKCEVRHYNDIDLFSIIPSYSSLMEMRDCQEDLSCEILDSDGIKAIRPFFLFNI